VGEGGEVSGAAECGCAQELGQDELQGVVEEEEEEEEEEDHHQEC